MQAKQLLYHVQLLEEAGIKLVLTTTAAAEAHRVSLAEESNVKADGGASLTNPRSRSC